jgi:lipopolysaccharide/colanic/teichoic acid biosynthesis glycosyltransferase
MPSGHKYVISEGGDVEARPEANVRPPEEDFSQKTDSQLDAETYESRNERRRPLFAPKHTVESVAEELLFGLESGLLSLGDSKQHAALPHPSANLRIPPTSKHFHFYGIEVPRWKRILDHVVIWLSLPFWALLAILIAAWIKIVSPGPIFFRQERVGFKGKRFMILKFRTMKINVETVAHERHLEQLLQASPCMTKLDASGDPRIIPGGRFLRATGLDELAQIANVLRGEMSIVGPRPCTPHEFNHYQPWQRERVNSLPGLTGYWQVNGKNKTTFTEMMNMDIFYTQNMSLRLDLAIMVRTFPAILLQLIEVRKVRHRPGGPKEASSAITHEP